MTQISSFLNKINKLVGRTSGVRRNMAVTRRIGVFGVIACVFAFAGYGFNLSKYAEHSHLSTGKWVKVSVPQSGLYAITPAQLRQWGFSDASRVRICGYGGKRIDDVMSSASYIDDLPVIPTVITDNGSVAFYGVGPETWTASVAGRYTKTDNIYTTDGFYFVTQVEENDTTLIVPEFIPSGREAGENTVDYFWQRLQHEQELTSPGKAGPQLVGEDFRLTPTRDFSFNLTDRIDNDDTGVWFETSFVAKTQGQSSQLTFTANGVAVPEVSTDRISATISDPHYHGTETITRHTLADHEGDVLNLRVSHKSPVVVSGAWLNYIAVNYQRKLRLDNNGQLMFWTNASSLSLGNATATTRVFDVTNPGAISEVNISALTADGRRTWTPGYTGWRTYVAFNSDANLPAPQFVGNMANQDLHAIDGEDIPDMVIVCYPHMFAQAQRIVKMHAEDVFDPMKVMVVDIDKVYNEFSSGAGDVSGLRKFFKMLWDRGAANAPEGYASKFRYAILLGRTSYDARMLTAEVKAFTTSVVPTWMNGTMRQSLNDTDGYGSDDFMALLKDNSGNDKGLDDLCIAIGRIPVRTAAEAANYIDKLEQYVTAPRKSGWKASAMFLADDGDNGRHLEQSESFIKNMNRIKDNPIIANKVYMDAYIRESNAYPGARDAMFRLLNEGVVWWSFIGHANDHSLTHNDQLTYNDLNNMLYKNVPVFYAATCDFLRWDQNSLSGGEIMFSERFGGAISIISATRPVYIYENGLLSNAFGRQLGARDPNGQLLTVGEIYRRAKNNILTDAGSHQSNYNRLKFVLMGDPAMRLATPADIIDITEINGKTLNHFLTDPVELNALQSVSVKGVVRNPAGELRSDFNGIVTVTLYDSQFSTTTYGNPDAGTEGKVITFEQQGSRLNAVSTQVVNGEFEVKISVPLDINDNYRPAAIGTYAYSTETNDEAAGYTTNLYVYGFDEDAATDDVAPVIESMYLNHSSFNDGDVTDSSPMLIATISDDVAINLSTAGIGHSMTLIVDDSKAYNDVAMYFTPVTDGSAGGTINYPVSELSTGAHSLTLRVWDTSANSTTASLNFTVSDRVAPKIYDIYTDASPAHDKANFYISHDRPDRMATVTVEVFNMLGQPVWSRTASGISDMFTSTPVTWDLTDSGGRRVPRGIYLYRATITVDGETFDTGSRRLAVAAQ